MLWYIAFISILNLGLGYALAVYLGAPSWPGPLNADRLPEWPSPSKRTTTQQPLAAAPPPAEATPVCQIDEPIGAEPAGKPADAAHAADDAPAGPTKATPPAAPRDPRPAAQLVTREDAERLLAELAASTAGCDEASAALVEVNWDGQVDGDMKERLLGGVAGTVQQLIADRDVLARYSERQFLLVLPQSDAEQTALRAEQLRRKVEATKYIADGIQRPATLTCAVAGVGGNLAVAELSDMLIETLAEARRYGGNRTFMHDGLSPTPVVPLELGLGVQQCTI